MNKIEKKNTDKKFVQYLCATFLLLLWIAFSIFICARWKRKPIDSVEHQTKLRRNKKQMQRRSNCIYSQWQVIKHFMARIFNLHLNVCSHLQTFYMWKPAVTGVSEWELREEKTELSRYSNRIGLNAIVSRQIHFHVHTNVSNVTSSKSRFN